MAISRKPKSQDNPPGAVNVDALIAKGGSVAQDAAASTETQLPEDSERGVTSFTLRVPKEILEPLDAQRKKQIYKVPRQQWILEAIMQRLEREMLPYASKEG